jgi:hypothetical protein
MERDTQTVHEDEAVTALDGPEVPIGLHNELKLLSRFASGVDYPSVVVQAENSELVPMLRESDGTLLASCDGKLRWKSIN